MGDEAGLTHVKTTEHPSKEPPKGVNSPKCRCFQLFTAVQGGKKMVTKNVSDRQGAKKAKKGRKKSGFFSPPLPHCALFAKPKRPRREARTLRNVL